MPAPRSAAILWFFTFMMCVVGAQPKIAVPLSSLAGFLAGADFLPAAGAAVCLQNFFAEADRFGSDFYELVVGYELDGLFEA